MNKLVLKDKSMFLNLLKSVLLGVSFSLIAILIFAVLIRFLDIGDKYILPVNQVIKIISILIATFAFAKQDNKKGFLKGMLIGAVYSILAYLIFSILGQNIIFDMSTFSDIIFAALIGGICGIIAVNMKK